MTNEEFKHKYGKIRYNPVIEKRNPVCGINIKDRNRELMIKFKYNNITDREGYEFHDAIKKIIYKVMHTNNVMMDWDDVYQEIWKKITHCRHTWKEWKGTMVSTWITIVANSVINTLRQKVNKHNSRFCLYDDLFQPSNDSDSDGNQSQEKCDFLAFSVQDDGIEDAETKKRMLSEKMNEFLNSLSQVERHIYNMALAMEDKIIDSYDRNFKLPYNELKAKTGYDGATFAIIMYNIKKKYCEAFGVRFVDNAKKDDGSDTEYLF